MFPSLPRFGRTRYLNGRFLHNPKLAPLDWSELLSRKHPKRSAARKGRGADNNSSSSRQGRSPLAPFYIVLGVVALAGVGVLLYQLYGQEAPATEPVDIAMDSVNLSEVQGISVGQEDAPVVILEFADFQCPACGQYATFVTPVIKERLVESGTVRYVHYDFPLVGIHQHAFLAARAGRCALEQNGFWPYHDVLYANQLTWASAGDPTDLFVDYAGQTGLDAGSFESCLRSDRYAEEVTRSLRLGESLGVRGTPTIFVNGMRLPEPPSYEQLEQIVLEQAGVSGGEGASETVAETATLEQAGGS